MEILYAGHTSRESEMKYLLAGREMNHKNSTKNIFGIN